MFRSDVTPSGAHNPKIDSWRPRSEGELKCSLDRQPLGHHLISWTKFISLLRDIQSCFAEISSDQLSLNRKGIEGSLRGSSLTSGSWGSGPLWFVLWFPRSRRRLP